MVFITVVESVYWVVPTDSLYKADYVSLVLKRLTSAIDMGRVVSATPWPLYPREKDPVPIA